MKDYTAYMLAEVLKGTFEAYGSAYGHGVSGVNLAAKTGTGTYGEQTYQQYGLPDDAAKDVWINGFTPKYSMSVWMGFKSVKQGGVNSFVGHDEQEYPQYLLEDVMSDISPKDGKDFTKPDSVNGSDKDDLSVAGHPDDNTTSQNQMVKVVVLHQALVAVNQAVVLIAVLQIVVQQVVLNQVKALEAILLVVMH